MTTVALVELLWGGHHPTYFKHYAKTLLTLGHSVMGFCPNPEEVSQWLQQHIPQHSHQLHLFSIQEPSSPSLIPKHLKNSARLFNRWHHVSQTIQQASAQIQKTPDLVFFTWLDLYLGHYLTHPIVSSIFPYQWSGLYFQPTGIRIPLKMAWLRHGPLNPQSILKSPSCPGVALLDEGSTSALSQKINGKSAIPFPDIADTSPPDLQFPPLLKIKKKAKHRKIIGILGSLGKRKGILTFLKMAQQERKGDWFFLFAGKSPLLEPSLSAEEKLTIKKIVSAKPDNCYFHFEFIPGEPQFNALVNLCDAIFAVYENFPYSSNALTKAAWFEKPIIASNQHCIGDRLRQYNLGISVPPNSPSAALHALYRLAKSPIDIAAPSYKEYRQQHSQLRLNGAFEQLLSLT